MNMMKTKLYDGASQIVLTTLDADSGVRPASMETVADAVAANGAIGAAAREAEQQTEDGAERARLDARRATIVERLGRARSPFSIKLLTGLLEFHDKGGEALPRGGHKFHLRVTLSKFDLNYHDFTLDRGLREDVNVVAPLFGLEDMQSSAHVRGGPRADSIVGLARKTMDEMEANGEAVPRVGLNDWRASGAGFAKRMGVAFSTIRHLSMVKRELADRVKQGRLKVGEPFYDPDEPSRAERITAMKKARGVLKELARTGKPIPASAQRANKIDMDWLFDQADIADQRMREWLKCNEIFRHDLAEVIRKVRLKPVHLTRLDPRVVTYERIKTDGLPLLRQEYRTDHPQSEPNSALEEAWIANQVSMVNRFMKVADRQVGDDAAADFARGDYKSLVDAGHTSSVKGNAAYDSSMARWSRVALALAAATDYPASFSGALDAGMIAAGKNAPQVAEDIGSRKQLIHAWRQGVSLPTYQNFYLVALIEAALGMVPGTLSKRLPKTRNSRTMYGGRKEITLTDGRVVPLAGLWRYMHPDAPTWSEDRLRTHVEEAHDRVFGRDTAHRARQRVAMTNGYNLPEPDPTSPIWNELADLVGFMTGMIDDGRLRNPKSEWRSDGTVKLHNIQLSIFVRWLMLPIEAGGAGIEASQISFSLILNHRLVLRYIAWRVLRAADIEVDGKAIGPKITATEKMLLMFFSNLVDPVYGWLTQSWSMVTRPQPDPRTFRMPFIRAAKNGIDVVDDETCPIHAVMPEDLVRKLVTEDGWRGAAATSCAHIRSTGARFAQSYKLMRNPADLVMPILRHPFPIAVGLRMVRDALDNARPIETSPVLHAKDVQGALAFLVLLLVVFRSETTRDLTWRADGTGNVRRLADGYEIIVGAEHFKNGWSTELFGPSWNRRDYERTLGNWGSFNEVMDHYLTKCRPLLISGGETDLLFPPRKGKTKWTEGGFNYLVMAFTRKWCVYNPRYGTGMRGVRAFGPHPVRNIIATHIIRNHPTEDRWRLASIVLGTGIEKVKMRYGWVRTREELAKSDYLYDEASDIANSDAALY